MSVLLIIAFSSVNAFAQVTTSSLSGVVKTKSGNGLVGATVTATHQPTGTVYRTITRKDGGFNISNMNPGGPYSIEVTFTGFVSQTKNEIYLSLGETGKYDYVLLDKSTILNEVVVSGTRGSVANSRGGAETSIGRDKLQNLPTVGRNIYDFLRAVPQAKLGAQEGAVSIAGQNNRYNAFFIDGAVNNDVFGLSNSGTNGGQANIVPISIDAIDQFQVVLSPYDASIGNFTGGGINAITRSGTNKLNGSVYYFYRNQDLAGKTPTGLKSNAVKLANFNNKTFGFRVGGPLIKNKLFYFISAEKQEDTRPQPFDANNYTGNTKGQALYALRDSVIKRYKYDMGDFVNNPEEVNADRFTVKLDWNITGKQRLSLSHRYTNGSRVNTSQSSNGTINFYNNGFVFPTKTNSSSLELKSSVGNGSSNRLLVTFTKVEDDRNPITAPFPRVTIRDGSGSLIFGPDNSSTQNLLEQNNFTIFDAFKFNLGKNFMTVGTDNEINASNNVFIQNTFGNYTYSTIADFYNNAKPNQYQVGYSLVDNDQTDNTAAAAKFRTARVGFFVNDELRVNDRLTLNFGVRADKVAFLTKPITDPYTNDSALAKFSKYYDLQGARSGSIARVPFSISPRLGFTWKIPEQNLIIRGGMGMFTGRVPLVWPGGVYNNTGNISGGYIANSSQNAAALNTIRFRSDPYGQWKASEVGISLAKGAVNFISSKFKMPKLFRLSLAADKNLGRGWTFTTEAIYSANVNEIYYQNVNLLPPIGQSVGAGARNVYPATNVIPIASNGSNPYTNVILLSNNKGAKGFSYNFTVGIEKRYTNGFSFNMNYTYGNSMVVNEGTSSVNNSQWQFMESVNGRNFLGLSKSDFDLGHRIFAFASKKFTYAKKSMATTISLVYTGQSGSPYSYIYGSTPFVRDAAVSGGVTSDLIYVPTKSEIGSMVFLNNTVGATTYTPAQQAAAFDTYIDNDKYLSKRRGQFAERNGARLPFTHVIDLKLAQDFVVKVSGKSIKLQVTYDVFNFTNMISRRWGRNYFLSNDQFSLLNFAGFASATNLTPQFRFNPTISTPYNISTTPTPAYSARWVSQLGVRINFND
ncbi:MAG: carboxypeptidase regulatory-like domain-containing protein [Sphingobacteriales bacterium]|nr:carboxypeptidase regulatory-like domain-containing protein [Sphingobacteriales bacterium]